MFDAFLFDKCMHFPPWSTEPVSFSVQFSFSSCTSSWKKPHCAPGKRRKSNHITNKKRIYFTVKYMPYSLTEVPITSKSCIFSPEPAWAIDILLVLYVPRCMNYYCHSPFYISSSIAYSNTLLLAVGDYKGPLAMVVIDQTMFNVCLLSNAKMC